MKLIVGLGNPGREYAHTRHNMGYDVIDKFADSLGVSFDKENFKGVYCKTRFLDEELFLLKPETYMNLSGECVAQFAKYYKIDNDDIIVIFDDLVYLVKLHHSVLKVRVYILLQTLFCPSFGH